MSHEAKQFRSLILNHVDEGQSWGVVASEFNGYASFVRWLESEPLHEDHVSHLHAIDMKWREELEKTAKNKKKASGTQ